jgi:hypothetical protein
MIMVSIDLVHCGLRLRRPSDLWWTANSTLSDGVT